ncbi:MAG TPA: hypothetical protein VKJ83_04880 [Actinomycetota bacterium]|nr:hypothetical protein [Actinomycetota bacterium]
MSGSGDRSGKGRSRAPGGRANRGGAGRGKRPGPAGTGAPGVRQPQGPPVVGKRPSRPGFLAVLAVLWFAAAIFAYFGLHTGWKLIPVICFTGVGILYLRGAAGSYLRRPGPASTTKE